MPGEPGKPTSPEDLAETVRLREKGLSLRQIGKRFGITDAAVNYRLKRAGYEHKVAKRKCALTECAVMFYPKSSRHRCCCRKHVKRQSERERVGREAYASVCLFPGCSEPTFVRGKYGKWCCRQHYETHRLRVQAGFYGRLFGICSRCIECGEQLAVDDHHVVWDPKNGSSGDETVPLCPTHHRAIHSGYAVIRDGKFVWLLDELREEVRKKHPELVPKGASWAEAKG